MNKGREMSLDVMKQALAVLEEIADEVFSPYDNKLGDAILALRAAIKEAQHSETEAELYKRLYELRGKALERPCINCGHQPAKIKAMAQTGSAQSGLAEKVPARGTILEQNLGKVWDKMPHPDYQKEMEQEPVAWTTMPDDEDWLFISGTSDPNGMLDGKWNPLYTAPVDAVNIKLKHVDETAKRKHEPRELKEKNT